MAKPRAFVIEDQADLSMLYEDALRLVGFDVEVIRTGLDAINIIQIKDPPALITLDVNLPGLSGHEVYRHICSNKQYTHIPVLISTANSVMALKIQAELRPIDNIFIKPVSMLVLQKLAQKALVKAKEQLVKNEDIVPPAEKAQAIETESSALSEQPVSPEKKIEGTPTTPEAQQDSTEETKSEPETKPDFSPLVDDNLSLSTSSENPATPSDPADQTKDLS